MRILLPVDRLSANNEQAASRSRASRLKAALSAAGAIRSSQLARLRSAFIELLLLAGQASQPHLARWRFARARSLGEINITDSHCRAEMKNIVIASHTGLDV